MEQHCTERGCKDTVSLNGFSSVLKVWGALTGFLISVSKKPLSSSQPSMLLGLENL